MSTKQTGSSQSIDFLQFELGIPSKYIETALRHPEPHPSLLPMILWQYGLITLSQLGQFFDWMESEHSQKNDNNISGIT